MKRQFLSLATAGTLLFATSAMAVADDRPPTPEERAKIEETLRAAGYVVWEEIELDDGLWEVDDAMKAGDTREFDLKLDPNTYEIIRVREDD
ncbi:MAG: PepSY domain-containing protein [Pseudomonadota bacterium]